MNCKPGDTVLCTSLNPRFSERRFLVLEAAPAHKFNLPDGQAHIGCRPGYWVLQALDGPVEAELVEGLQRLQRPVQYAVGSDDYLRPTAPESISQAPLILVDVRDVEANGATTEASNDVNDDEPASSAATHLQSVQHSWTF
jgi:hypothetical protein